MKRKLHTDMNEVYTREWPPFDPPYRERKCYRDFLDKRMGEPDVWAERIWKRLQHQAVEDPYVNYLELIEIRHHNTGRYPDETVVEIEYWECITDPVMVTAHRICK